MSSLDAVIESDPRLVALYESVKARASNDPAHDLWHFRRVAMNGLRIRPPSIPPSRIVAAALVHDIVHVPKNSPDRQRASQLCAEAARPLLLAAGFLAGEVSEIAEAVATHSYSRGVAPTSELGAVLRDADRLEALGMIGLMRCVATGVQMGGRMFHPEDPFAVSRPLDDTQWSLDHFYTKLLKLPATMMTEAGRAEADRRAEFLLRAADALAQELHVTIPPSRKFLS